MATEVDLQPGAKPVHPDGGHQLLEDRGPLPVGDAVEVQEGLVGRGDLVGDAVGGGALVLDVGPQLHAGVEVEPDRRVAAHVLERQVGHVGGEGLVEPQVVPPAHGDQVAEPHVGQFVGEVLRPPGQLVLGGRVTEDHRVGVPDGGDVLHAAPVELGHEDLVVLAERVGLGEEVLVEVDARLGDGEQGLGVQVGQERSAAVDAHRDATVGVLHAGVVAGEHRHQVGAEGNGLGEDTAGAPVGQRLAGHLGPGAHHRPVGRGGHRHAVGGLEVGLVEAGEEAVRRVGLELGVEVLGPVLGIEELVEALAGVVVGSLVGDPDLVVAAEQRPGQGDAGPVPVGLHLRPVDHETLEPAAQPLEEGVAPGVVEGDGDVAVEGLGPGLQVEVDGVGDGGQLLDPASSLLEGEAVARGVGGLHAGSFARRRRAEGSGPTRRAPRSGRARR